MPNIRELRAGLSRPEDMVEPTPKLGDLYASATLAVPRGSAYWRPIELGCILVCVGCEALPDNNH